MSDTETAQPRWNYGRRALGVAICLAPVLLLVASPLVGEPSDGWAMGLGLAVCALPVALLNFYLSVVRPALYRRRRGSMEGYRHISGVPLFGNLLVVIGGVIGFGDWRTASVGLVALALDTGGLPWFLATTWRDHSMWDE
jgi:hypothetical protein